MVRNAFHRIKFTQITDTEFFNFCRDNMSKEAAESQENASGPGTQSGIGKIVEENMAKLSADIKTLALAVQTMHTDVSEFKRKAPPAGNDSSKASNPKKSQSDLENRTNPSTSGTQ